MAKAIWNGTVLAESDATVVVEGKHYFPQELIKRQHLRPSATQTQCFRKGAASYYDVVVEGQVNKDAAWYYPQPSAAAHEIAKHIAFWRGVRVEA